MDLKKDIIKLEHKNGLQQISSKKEHGMVVGDLKEVGILLKVPAELNKRIKLAVKINKVRPTQNILICDAIEKFLDELL